MARPHLAENQKRSQTIYVMANPDEVAGIKDIAKEAGMTVSQYIRHTALKTPLPKRATNIEAEAIAALNRVGSNLNQIAKIANTNGALQPSDIKALKSGFNEAFKIAAQIKGSIQ